MKPVKRKRRRKIVRHGISLSDQYFNSLMKSIVDVQQNRGIRFKSWGSFIDQAANLMMGETLFVMGKTTTYNQYIYGAICPKCNGETIINMQKQELVKRVTCKCRRDFVVFKRR